MIFEDNANTVKLLHNFRESSIKRARHFNIRLFYVKYLMRNHEVKVTYFPTERVIYDYNSKRLVGGKLKMFRDVILDLSGTRHFQVGQQECVGGMNK